jgi:hypothetical protein
MRYARLLLLAMALPDVILAQGGFSLTSLIPLLAKIIPGTVLNSQGNLDIAASVLRDI